MMVCDGSENEKIACWARMMGMGGKYLLKLTVKGVC